MNSGLMLLRPKGLGMTPNNFNHNGRYPKGKRPVVFISSFVPVNRFVIMRIASKGYGNRRHVFVEAQGIGMMPIYWRSRRKQPMSRGFW